MEQMERFKKRIQLLNTVFGPMNTKDKIEIISNLLEDGVDINEIYCEYNNNTLLHIATIERDKDIVKVLLNKGAGVYKNNEGKTYLDIEKELSDEDDLVSKATSIESHQQTNLETSNLKPNEDTLLFVDNLEKHRNLRSKLSYKKETGTAGIAGQLYETKLLSLILYKALHDSDIEEFYLATNICGVNPFDDICLRFKIKGNAKSFAVFIQAKHKDNPKKRGITAEDLCNPNSDFYLKKYIKSFSKIKEMFNRESKDVLFKGEFNQMVCIFIIYTPAAAKFDSDNFKRNHTCDKIIQSLISTGKKGKVFQLCGIPVKAINSNELAGETTLQSNNPKLLSTVSEDLKAKAEEEICNDNSSYVCDTNNSENNSADLLETEFFQHLWFFTGQSKEDQVEDILKIEIVKQFDAGKRRDQDIFRVHTDAVYLLFHNYVQKWWMLQNKAYYLGKDNDFFKKAKTNAVVNPLLCILNFTFINKLKKNDIEFNSKAVQTLKLDQFTSGLLNVVSDVIPFSNIKLTQYFYDMNNQFFIDFDDVDTLSSYKFNNLIAELRKTHLDTMIVSYERTKRGICEKLGQIVSEFIGKRIIIISDKALAKEFPMLTKSHECVRDETIDLIHLTSTSQLKILKKSYIIYQGKLKPLDKVIDVGSRNLIRAKILYKLMLNETIVIGKTLTDSNYEDQKKYYVDRSVTKEGRTYNLKSLRDLEDVIIPIIGDPGMGKSSLFTHLSIETGRMYPQKWIARINLNDYSSIFRKWKQEGRTVNIIKTLKFVCRATINEMEYNEVNFELTILNGDLILTKSHNIPEYLLLEIELFIYLCNKGEVIFLFDGFDEICPQYEKQVIAVINRLTMQKQSEVEATTSFESKHNKKHRVWVSARPYVNVIKTLQREFKILYDLAPLDQYQRDKYFMTFWYINIKLWDLKLKQLKNIDCFLDFISRWLDTSNVRVLPSVYEAGLKYFTNELIKYPSLKIGTNDIRKKLVSKLQSILEHLDSKVSFRSRSKKNIIKISGLDILGKPIYLYIIANYFQSLIKDHTLVKEDIEKFDLNGKTFIDLFMMTIINRMFQDKFRLNIDKSNIEPIYKIALKEFRENHKKLATYVIFYENFDQLEELLSIDEVNTLIKTIQLGEEKTGLIVDVINNVPKFIHSVLAESLAVEYICDMLQILKSYNKRKYLWNFIMNILLMKSRTAIVNTFFTMCKKNTDLNELINDYVNSKIVFDIWIESYVSNRYPNDLAVTLNMKLCKNHYLLIKHGMEHEITCKSSLLELAICNDLNDDIVHLIIKSIRKHLNNDNADHFIEILNRSGLLLVAEFKNYCQVVDDVINIMKEKIDIQKFRNAVSDDLWNINVDLHVDSLEPIQTNKSFCTKEAIFANLRLRVHFLARFIIKTRFMSSFALKDYKKHPLDQYLKESWFL